MSLRASERIELRRLRAAADDGRQRRRRQPEYQVGPRVFPRRILRDRAKLWTIPQLVQLLSSDDIAKRFEATSEFRKLLSIEPNPAIEEVISCGAVPCFVQLLDREECPQLQFESAWALSSIVSRKSKNTKVVVDHGAVPIFVNLLSSPIENISELALRALGNIAGESAIYRDIVLAHGVLFPLLQLLNEHPRTTLLRNATWALRNLCRGRPQPNFEHVKAALPVLRQLINSQDEEVLGDACWALSYLSDSSNDSHKIQYVIDAGACPRLAELLTHSSSSVLIPALRVVGNIVTGNDEQTQAVINRIVIGPLVHLMQTAKFDIQREAARAISNVTSGGKHDQIKYLVSQGCIKAFCDLLSYVDTEILTVCLESLENILKAGEAENDAGACDVNIYAQMIDEAEGLDKIENLQTHENNTIYEMAVHLLESYYIEEDDVEAMPVGGDAPQNSVHNGNQQAGEFNFG
uniref:Importin subunit alpha n=1 Tax=Arundo donax TaxID=35708 RepID=A0A0A8ZAZ5_ARUDO